MTTYDGLAPRMKSQRLLDRANKEKTVRQQLQKSQQQKPITKPVVTDLYPGLNEVTDAFQAFPFDLIRYFTLLREIDAKCVNTVPHLKAYIQRFLQMKRTHPKRELLLSRIRELLKDLMPCLEEKMHVATIASDTVNKHLRRINQNYAIVIQEEIPESVRVGPLIHPCMKVIEQKSAQTQRSESRREALAAKKAHKTGGIDDDEHELDSARGTPAPSHGASTGSIPSLAVAGSSSAASSSRRPKKERKDKENGFNDSGSGSGSGSGSAAGIAAVQPSSGNSSNKKRKTQQAPANTVGGSSEHSDLKKPKTSKSKKEKKPREHEHGHVSGGSALAATHALSSGVKVDPVSTSSSYDTEPVYCYCQQVSYGEMVGCDGEHCEREWFHLPCTGLKELPRGEWYCDDCKSKMKAVR